MRTYSELIKLPSFKERFEYLKLSGGIGVETFGFDRYLNQKFYMSSEWKRARRDVIIRDNGCDLGLEDFEIGGRIIVHHMNPLDIDDVLMHRDSIIDPEFLICVSELTHNAIHYGDMSILITEPTVRTPNDTCPWKRS